MQYERSKWSQAVIGYAAAFILLISGNRDVWRAFMKGLENE
jgi:hypothetical protein